MEREPSFERFRKAVMREGEPDWVPQAEIYIYYGHKDQFLAQHKIDVPPALHREKNIEREVAFYSLAGYDYLPVEVNLRYCPEPYKGTYIEHAREGLFLDYTIRRDAQHEGRAWKEEGEGIIRTIEDFNSFPWPTVDELNFSYLEKAGAYLSPGMKVVGLPGRLFQGIRDLMGFELFCMALGKNPLLVEKMFDKLGRLQTDLVREMVKYSCVGAVWIGDDMAYANDLIINPKIYRKYLFPWFKEMASLCKEKEIPFILHSDGKLDKIMDDIIECGVNAIHPIEPKAMDIVQVKGKYGDRVALIGNIDLAYTLTRGTPEEVEQEVKERIRTIAPGGGYCLGSSNSITDFVPYENYVAMLQAAYKYGKYPIDL